jgi:hypothetical protein
VPAAVIVLVAAVALQFRPGRPPIETTLPQMSPQVVLPELGSSAPPSQTSAAKPSGSGSASASRTATATPTPAATRSTAGGQPGIAAPPGPQRGSIVGIGGRCLEPVADGAITYIQLATCAPVDKQRWNAPGDRTVRVLGQCLDVMFSAEGNGTPVNLYSCNGTDAQEWEIRGDGTWRNPQSNRCLSTAGGGQSAGTRLNIFDCTGAASQRWTLT